MKNRMFLAACLMMSFAVMANDARDTSVNKCFACEFVKENAPASSDKAALVLKVKELLKEGNVEAIVAFVKTLSSDEVQQAILIKALLQAVVVEEEIVS